MDKSILVLEEGTACTAWNYSGHRLAAGLDDGTVVIYDATDPASSTFNCTSKFKVKGSSISKIVWCPPEYGDAVACVTDDGELSMWEEVLELENADGNHWKLCKLFERSSSRVLDIQFGGGQGCLKLAAVYTDGQTKIYELLDTLVLERWQLQAEFHNIIGLASKSSSTSCLSASVSWNPQRSDARQSSFVVGFNSNTPDMNSAKVWEFDQDHQRWLPVAELSLPEDKDDPVYAVSWASNIGRPYELIAVATQKGISIWHLGSSPDSDGRLSVNRVSLLSGHDDEVWQMEWDMSGMTLATTGGDGVVRLWQSDLNGVWREQATLAPST